MQQRVKVFTYISGTGSTVIESSLEDHINEWLEKNEGRLIRVTQSESERHGQGHHVTVCAWYEPHGATVQS